MAGIRRDTHSLRLRIATTSSPPTRVFATGRRSGYAMSRTAKEATRFFWATSDGQIYPQLRKLSDSGYIDGWSITF